MGADRGYQRTMRPIRAGCFMLLTALALAACANPNGPEDPQRSLDENRRKFRAVVGSSYRVDYQHQCFCPPQAVAPVRLTVREGSITGVEPLSAAGALPRERWGAYRTVEGVFDAIQEAFARGARQVTVRYDQGKGYPADVDIDFQRELDAWDGFKLGNVALLR